MKQISLLCLLMITGTITCEDEGFIRVVVRVGEDVVLPCSLSPEVDIEPASFDWKKDQQEVFLYDAGTYHSGDSQFKGRVSHFPDKLKNGDASILIRNIQLSDSGNYSCYFPRLQEQRFYIELFVGITAVTVKEDDDIILSCSFGTNIQNEPFSWKKDVDQSNEKDVFWYSGGDTDPDPGPEFRGRISYFPDQLQIGNASIKITKVKISDSGTYTCYHATVQKEIKSTISLTVDPILKPRPEIEGASPKPRIESVTVTNNQVQLQCEVLGAFPKPVVVWKDSDGKTLPADEPKVTEKEGNKYDTVLLITVTKTDHYNCVATQKEIYHQINSSIAVTLNVSDGTCWGWIIGVIVALVAVAVLIVPAVFGVLYFRELNRLRSNMRESQDNHNSSLHSSHVLETGEMMKAFRCELYDDHLWMKSSFQVCPINPTTSLSCYSISEKLGEKSSK